MLFQAGDCSEERASFNKSRPECLVCFFFVCLCVCVCACVCVCVCVWAEVWPPSVRWKPCLAMLRLEMQERERHIGLRKVLGIRVTPTVTTGSLPAGCSRFFLLITTETPNRRGSLPEHFPSRVFQGQPAIRGSFQKLSVVFLCAFFVPQR